MPLQLPRNQPLSDQPWERLYEEIQEKYACSHDETRLCFVVASNGVRHYRAQCLRCGNGRVVRRADVPAGLLASLPPFDEALKERWDNEKWGEHRTRLDELTAERNEQWWRDYSDYLETPEWGSRRARVMERANRLCEGCRLAHATTVHHLTYERVFNELLIDLVALCRDCHQRAHPHKQL